MSRNVGPDQREHWIVTLFIISQLSKPRSIYCRAARWNVTLVSILYQTVLLIIFCYIAFSWSIVLANDDSKRGEYGMGETSVQLQPLLDQDVTIEGFSVRKEDEFASVSVEVVKIGEIYVVTSDIYMERTFSERLGSLLVRFNISSIGYSAVDSQSQPTCISMAGSEHCRFVTRFHPPKHDVSPLSIEINIDEKRYSFRFK